MYYVYKSGSDLTSFFEKINFNYPTSVENLNGFTRSFPNSSTSLYQSVIPLVLWVEWYVMTEKPSSNYQIFDDIFWRQKNLVKWQRILNNLPIGGGTFSTLLVDVKVLSNDEPGCSVTLTFRLIPPSYTTCLKIAIGSNSVSLGPRMYMYHISLFNNIDDIHTRMYLLFIFIVSICDLTENNGICYLRIFLHWEQSWAKTHWSAWRWATLASSSSHSWSVLKVVYSKEL